MPVLALLLLVRRRLLAGGTVLALIMGSTACFVAVTSTEVRPVEAGQPIPVRTPIKVHLKDGSTVLFRNGTTVRGDSLLGRGVWFALSLRDSSTVTGIPRGTVAGIESYVRHIDPFGSLILSLTGTGVIGLAAAAAAVAIFGSCPTIYSDSAGHQILEAEGFSYSIAPLFEARDVDRLRVLPDSAGAVRLEVRNEAAETHYLNQLELLDVERRPDELVLPDVANVPLAVTGTRPALRVVDGVGRDRSEDLRAADGRSFASDAALVAGARPGRLYDTLFVTLPSVDADSAALVLRLRNSLLTTVLLYDVMLRRQGARALDWLGADLADIGSAMEVGRWYRREMGLRIEVARLGGWQEVGWIRDVGPIAFEDVGVVVPVVRGAPNVARLIFPIDSWRIDLLAVGAGLRRPAARRVPIAFVTGADGSPLAEVPSILRDPDGSYLETRPGQLFTAHFAVGAGPSDRRTLLLVTHGYYSEWLRPSWLEPQTARTGFAADSTSLADALDRWRTARGPLERQFAATKIPVR